MDRYLATLGLIISFVTWALATPSGWRARRSWATTEEANILDWFAQVRGGGVAQIRWTCAG